MKKLSGISDFLESQSGPVESEGSFTIDSHRAFQKLSQFQLPSPGHWVVKLVQAAVRMEAEGIDFQFGRKYVKINILMASPPTADQILEDVLKGGLGLDPARQHLVTGIRYIWGRYPKELLWECHHDQGWSKVCAVTGQTEEQAAPPSHYRGIKMLVHAAVVKAKPRFLRLETEQTMSCVKALTDLCWTSPITVRIDSRRINKPFPPSYTQATLVVGGPRQGPVAIWLEENEDGFPVRLHKNPGEADSGGIRQRRPPTENGWFEHRSDGKKTVFSVDYLLSVYFTYAGDLGNRLWWIKDGVLLGPVALTGWGVDPMDIFFNGRDLRTDLGGFLPATTDFHKEMLTSLDTLKKLLFQLTEQKAPSRIIKRLKKKVAQIEALLQGKDDEQSRESFQTLEQTELTPDNLPYYLDRLSELQETGLKNAVGTARFLSAHRKFFFHGRTLDAESARRWWSAVIEYYQDPEELAVPSVLIHAQLQLALLESDPELSRKLAMGASRGAIAKYACSEGTPDPLLGLSFLELARHSPELVTPNMWEAVMAIAETGFNDEIERLLAEELRCAEALEERLPVSFRERLHFLHRHGPWRHLPGDDFATTAALRHHWREMNWLWAAPRTLGIMGLGVVSFKLGPNLGIYGLATATAATRQLLDKDLRPLWSRRKTREVLDSLQLPEEFRQNH